MNKEKVAELFSTGQFIKVYDFIAENAKWEVVEENNYIGKKEIVENCEQVTKYFKSVTTNFITKNIISNHKVVVIEGTAEFIRDNKTISFVTACDLYRFNDQDQIESITSYCIQREKTSTND